MCEFPRRVVLVVPRILVFPSLLPQWHAARWRHIMFPASRCSWASGHAGKNRAGMCSGRGEGGCWPSLTSRYEVRFGNAQQNRCLWMRLSFVEREKCGKQSRWAKREVRTWDAPLPIPIQISEVQYRPITIRYRETELNRLKVFI